MLDIRVRVHACAVLICMLDGNLTIHTPHTVTCRKCRTFMHQHVGYSSCGRTTHSSPFHHDKSEFPILELKKHHRMFPEVDRHYKYDVERVLIVETQGLVLKMVIVPHLNFDLALQKNLIYSLTVSVDLSICFYLSRS